MNLSLSCFIWNSSRNFPVKSVFRKLIKMLCWLWIFTSVTMFIRSYCNIPSCFTDIIFATITYTLVFSFKLNIDLISLVFQIITKEYFPFIEPSFENKQIQNQPDKLFKKLDNCLPSIKLKKEENPKKFLDTELMFKNGITEISTGAQLGRAGGGLPCLFSK